MSPSDKSSQIVNQFCKYIKTGIKSLIEPYTLEELKLAKYEFSRDSDREFYEAIEDRIRELEKIGDEKKKVKEKRIDRLITFVLGIIAGLLIAYLKGCFKL